MYEAFAAGGRREFASLSPLAAGVLEEKPDTTSDFKARYETSPPLQDGGAWKISTHLIGRKWDEIYANTFSMSGDHKIVHAWNMRDADWTDAEIVVARKTIRESLLLDDKGAGHDDISVAEHGGNSPKLAVKLKATGEDTIEPRRLSKRAALISQIKAAAATAGEQTAALLKSLKVDLDQSDAAQLFIFPDTGGPKALKNSEILLHQHRLAMSKAAARKVPGALTSTVRPEIANEATNRVISMIHPADDWLKKQTWSWYDDEKDFYALLYTPNVRPSAFLVRDHPNLNRCIESITTDPDREKDISVVLEPGEDAKGATRSGVFNVESIEINTPLKPRAAEPPATGPAVADSEFKEDAKDSPAAPKQEAPKVAANSGEALRRDQQWRVRFSA